MTGLLSSLRLPALAGVLTTLPFLVMEFVNRRQYKEPFPWQLFFILWFLSTGFTLALLPIIHYVRAGEHLLRKPLLLALRVAFLIALAYLWIQAVVDQMPCFLGVRFA